MPRVRCPDCDTRFSATGRRAECPDCGYRFRIDDEDEVDDRQERRRRQAKYSSGKNAVPLLIVGGAVAVVVVFGLIGLVVYSAVSRTREAARRAAAAPAPVATTAPAATQQQTAPNPLQQPLPDDVALANQQPQPGNANPPPARKAAPAAGQQLVTLSNFRRGGGGNGFGPAPPGTISVDYEYNAGVEPTNNDIFIIKDDDGFHESNSMFGMRRARGTMSFRTLGGPFGQLRGKVEIWMERKPMAGPFGARGERISNVLTLN